MLGGDDLALPYPWIMSNNITMRGQWMYFARCADRDCRSRRSGLLSLSDFSVTTFPLADVNVAVEHAAVNGGAFK